MTCLFKFYTTKSQQHSFQETVIAGFQPNNIENKTAIFQYFNISRKQENKPDGMIERKQSFNRESKLSLWND